MTLTTVPVGIMQTNCYIIASERGNAAVIDPGDDAGGRLANRITNLGVSVKYIFLTHGHFDHIGAVKEIAKRTGAKVIAAREDVELLRDPGLVLNRVQSSFTEKYHVVEDACYADGDVIPLDELEFHIIATPGHTRGGVTIMAGDCLFTGDTLFKDTCGRTDLYGASQEEMLASLMKLAALPGDYKVYPGHGEATTLDRERKHNPAMLEAMRKSAK